MSQTKIRKRAVVIEDVPDLLKRMRILLENEGFEVFGATNGEAGLKLAKDHKPDLICVDLTLPKLSGFDVCEAVRADANLKTTPLIVISARSTPDTKQQAEDCGADAYIVKPFKTRELMSEITRVIEQKKQVALQGVRP
ncbi:MAG: response regulator [Deltaproteobacteria bacterium]|nr:response regulator [Deltaproteobacteria bacterium]